MSDRLIKQIKPLGFQWETDNPFLFCVHHNDLYPKGNSKLGPDASLSGRSIGNDFILKDGWRMYHGREIPGFPVHPHRGFETITIVLKGFVDHSDSLGAAGRYGGGDVQWMTAGAGIQHAEMFPLLDPKRENPLELFQIWLNLPADDKFADPHYRMFWSEDIPRTKTTDKAGKVTDITLIAGELGGKRAIAPPPESWAADEKNDVAIWLVRMDAGAILDLPVSSDKANRSLYFYEGSEISIGGTSVESYRSVSLDTGESIPVINGSQESRLLFLQGLPINEPVVQYGPFVMNSRNEIQQAMDDYRKTEFGGWPWPRPDQVHGSDRGRFARYADGSEEDR